MKANSCRMCKGERLVQWLDLGLSPHSDHFHKEREAEMFYPLGVSVCEDCGLNQLTYIVAKEELYLKDYLYESSITKTADAHWTEFAETVCKKINLPKGSLVVDIGGNDGTLLTKFQALGHDVINIDPTPEATQIAIDRGVPTIQKFFSSDMVLLKDNAPIFNPKTGVLKSITDKECRLTAELIVGANVFAHVNDLDDFITGIDEWLSENGVFVFESPYFGEFLKGLEYSTVYHQHLSYLSLRPVVKFLAKHGLEVFDVEQHELHGGGFRVYIARKGEREVTTAVHVMLENETWEMRDLEHFAEEVAEQRKEMLDTVLDIKCKGGTIAVVSTPAKGNTFLNYTLIGPFIDFATDKSKLKQGRFLPGTGIEVFPDSELVKRQPTHMILLAWNFSYEVIENLRKLGVKGKVLIPQRTIEIIDL